MRGTRVAAKFLPHAHVQKKQTNVTSDVVTDPAAVAAALIAGGGRPAVPFDPALSIDESQTKRIQEYWVTFKMSIAQVEAEEHEEAAWPTTRSTEATAGLAVSITIASCNRTGPVLVCRWQCEQQTCLRKRKTWSCSTDKMRSIVRCSQGRVEGPHR
jgi:hypothetical protein